MIAVAAARQPNEIPGPRESARDRIGAKAPALRAKGWLNTPGGAPQTQGKAVLIRFWTDGCPFCERTAPALNEFHKEFAERGLVVVGMYHPKPIGRKANAEEVRAAARELGFQFPIGIDEDWSYLNEIWLESGEHERRATSSSFLVDRKGIIRWAHPGTEYFKSDLPEEKDENQDYEDLKEAIEALQGESQTSRATDQR